MISRIRNGLRPADLALVLALSLLGGCFGSFRLTRTVYGFNQGVTEDETLREVLFVGFLVVPVYPLAILVDGVVLNAIEYATGENPLATTEGRTRDGRRVAVTTEADGSLTIAVDGERVRRLLRRGRRLELVEDERVVAVVQPMDDGRVWVEADGLVRVIEPERVAALDGLDGAALVEAVAGAWGTPPVR